MDYFYDGQIRRYILQVIRFFSNFVVKYGDGTLVRVPVMYGDVDRQVANIIKQNSENKINSVPRIAVYVGGLELDRERLADQTFVGKVHVRERSLSEDGSHYTYTQGENYTVERLMPTPYKLSLKVDIWTGSTDQKLQLMEQILVLFNPSIELQTTDNYIDWTSLTVLNLDQTVFSSRAVPVGNDSPIDIATLSVSTPIWISPPVKVKQLGIITNIISNVFNGVNTPTGGYIDGLGFDPGFIPEQEFAAVSTGTGNNELAAKAAGLMARAHATVGNFGIQVYGGVARLLDIHEAVLPDNDIAAISKKIGPAINWRTILDQYPGRYRAGYSLLRLIQEDGNEVIGTVALNPLDETVMAVTWDPDTYPTNNGIDSNGLIQGSDSGYDGDGSYRPGSPGTFDAIIDPQKTGPRGSGLINPVAGTRYLIIEAIGDPANNDGPDAWKDNLGNDFYAGEFDIIEWTGSAWDVIFNAAQNAERIIYQTNIYTGVQYKWNGVSWVKSFEGEYRAGKWVLQL